MHSLRYLPQNYSETCMKDVHVQYSINLIIDLSSIAIHKSSCLRHGVAFKQKRCLSCLRHLLFKIHEKKIPNIFLRRSCSPIYREKMNLSCLFFIIYYDCYYDCQIYIFCRCSKTRFENTLLDQN